MRRRFTFNTGETTYHLGITHAHPNVVSGGSPGRIKKIATYLDSPDSKPEIIESDRGLVTVHGTYNGLAITCFSTGMGPASVSITMPEIIEACDDDDMIFIRIGTSGGLQQQLNIGDFVASTWFQRAESTCDKIMGKGYRAESDTLVTEALVTAALSTKMEYQQVYKGPTRVTDDIYFDALETKQRASEQPDHNGILAVSMEGSVYCALRDRYNKDDHRTIHVGELLVISDNVVANDKHIDLTQFKKRQPEIEDTHIRAGLEALVALRRASIKTPSAKRAMGVRTSDCWDP